MSPLFETLLHKVDSLNLYVAIGGIAAIFIIVRRYVQNSKSRYPIPPGPKGFPIIGNFGQVPAERSEVQFAKWSKELSELIPSRLSLFQSWWCSAAIGTDANIESDIIYLNLLGQPVVVLNSVQSAVDLLEKRGAIYSDRPSFVVIHAYFSFHSLAENALLIHSTVLVLRTIWVLPVKAPNFASSGEHTAISSQHVVVWPTGIPNSNVLVYCWTILKKRRVIGNTTFRGMILKRNNLH